MILFSEDSVSVTDYDKITSGPLVDFITASGKIGGLVNEQVCHDVTIDHVELRIQS